MVSVLLAFKLLRKTIEIINTKFTPSVVNKKVKNKPRVIRAGSPRTKSDTDKGKRNLQMKRLQESGHVRDASVLFEDFVEL